MEEHLGSAEKLTSDWDSLQAYEPDQTEMDTGMADCNAWKNRSAVIAPCKLTCVRAIDCEAGQIQGSWSAFWVVSGLFLGIECYIFWKHNFVIRGLEIEFADLRMRFLAPKQSFGPQNSWNGRFCSLIPTIPYSKVCYRVFDTLIIFL